MIFPERRATVCLLMILLASTSFFIPFNGSSDPAYLPESDGVSAVKWDFSNSSAYNLENINLEPGYANLSLNQLIWAKKTQADFNNGSASNLDVFPDGSVCLSKTDTLQLINNGNFTYPDDGLQTSTPENWLAEFSTNAMFHTSFRDNAGGIDDGLYAWKNSLYDFDSGGYNATVWLNQTFNMPSIPLTVNISALHNFQNKSQSFLPGSMAEVWVTNLNTSQKTVIYSSEMTNMSFIDYKPIWWNEPGIFSTPGTYNLTLLTFTDTGGDLNSTCFTGLDNYWDNASVEFSAYNPHGTYVSEVFDTGSYSMWGKSSWTQDLPPGTNIEVFVRTGNSSVSTDSIWSAWSSPLTDPSGSEIDCPWGRYVQFRVEFDTISTNVTPTLSNFTISYMKFSLGGAVETQDFSPASIIQWGFFTHSSETHGQKVLYFYSADSGSSWFNIPIDGDLRFIPLSVSKIRIRCILNTTDTVVSPSVNWLQISYVTANPQFSLIPIWNRTGASPGEQIRLLIYFNNTAQSISSTAWLNIYLDSRLQYIANNSGTLGIFEEYITDSNSGIQKFVFSHIPASNNSIWIDAKVKTGVSDGDILQNTVTFDYLGPEGNRVESKLNLAPIRVNGPKIGLDLRILNESADVGDRINYNLYVNNSGLGAAAEVWINGTLDDRLDGMNLSWELADLPGNSAILIPFNATLKNNVVQGSSIPMSLTCSYSDTSGFIQLADSEPVSLNAWLRSDFSLAVVSQSSAVNSSDMLVVTVHFNNSGYGSAESVEFNFTVPEGMEFVSSSEECIEYSGKCQWELSNVGPGPHSFTITLHTMELDEDIVTCQLIIFMSVTDPVDGIEPIVSSTPVSISITRIYTFWEKIYWPWSGAAMAAVISLTIFGLWYYFRPIPPSIDDAFVIYRDGRMISHRQSANGQKSGLDGDLVGAMLNAVQEFITDSLSNDKSDKVKKLEFGERELFLERGDSVNLVIIYTGSMNKKLEAQVKEITEKIEKGHPFLADWDGRMTQLADINPQLDELIRAWQRIKND